MASGAVFSLNVHASYACRHSGACCTAGWAIPVEPHALSIAGSEWLLPLADGACPQYDRDSRLCRIHRDHGEPMLPGSCHHFPRRALIDERGTFVTLSHFCPTAAALLVDSGGPLSIVSNPAAFPRERGYEGLDARGEWPPLLRPNVLFDHDSFAIWERFLVETVSAASDTVERTLIRVADAGERLRAWTPGHGLLSEWAAAIANRSDGADGSAGRRYASYSGSSAFLRAAATVPSGLEAPNMPPGVDRADAQFDDDWRSFAPVVLRYVAARAFASWTAYQSRGVRTQIAELFLTMAVLRVECVRACEALESRLDRDRLLEAVRASDLLLVHLADRQALVAWLGEAENDEWSDKTT